MKRINLILTAFLFLSCWGSFAQEVKVIYQVEEVRGQHLLSVHMQSTSESTVEIRGVNLSLALPKGCEIVSREGSEFESVWTNYLLQEVQYEGLELSYEGHTYDHRWQYGVADPVLPGTHGIVLPAASAEALPVMEMVLKGACATGLRLEHVSENHVNQIGGGDFKPIGYTIEQRGATPAADLLQDPKLVAYPNPVVDKLNIDFSVPENADFKIELIDLTGRTLVKKEQRVDSGVEYSLSMSLEDYAQGTYFVRLVNLTTGKTVESAKVVKQ